MKVSISINQVIDGLEYEGEFKIRETKFDYTLRFGVPIKELDNQPTPPADSPKETMLAHARKLFIVTLKKDDHDLEIDDMIYGFLLHTVIGFALEYYNMPQTRSSNEGAMGAMVRGEHMVTKILGGSVKIGMKTEWNIPEKNIPPSLLAA